MIRLGVYMVVQTVRNSCQISRNSDFAVVQIKGRTQYINDLFLNRFGLKKSAIVMVFAVPPRPSKLIQLMYCLN